MKKSAWLGNKIRRMRRERGLAQVELARQLGISPSYLNMIERSQRPVTLRLIGKLAEVLEVSADILAEDDDARLLSDLLELFGDPALAPSGVPREEAEELIGAAPTAARALAALHHLYRNARGEVDFLRERMTDEDFLSTSAHELRSALTPIRSFAEILRDHDNISRDERHRFAAILARESERLAEIIGRMLAAAAFDDNATADGGRSPADLIAEFAEDNDNFFPQLEDAAMEFRQALCAGNRSGEAGLLARVVEGGEVDVEIATDVVRLPPVRFDRQARRVIIPEALSLPSRTFAAVKYAAQVRYADAIDATIPAHVSRDPAARDACREFLSAYIAGATMMPYDAFLNAAQETRYDIERLQRRFHSSFEQVCHRTTSLQRADAKGVPVHFVRVDIAGNVSKRFSRSGFRIPRYGGLCPLLNIHTAFMTPERYCPQVARMPSGATFFSVARAVAKPTGPTPQAVSHFSIMLGCDVSDAENFTYSDALNLDSATVVTAAGVSCRLCDRADCAQRVHPPVLRSTAARAAGTGIAAQPAN